MVGQKKTTNQPTVDIEVSERRHKFCLEVQLDVRISIGLPSSNFA